MKSWFRWILLILVIAGVADGFYAYRWYFTRDGSTVKRAIVIRTNKNDEVQLEDQWMRRLYPLAGIIPLEQALLCRNGILYDFWLISTPSGKRDMYFDLGPNKEICNEKSEAKHAK
jgi:hypothetical protein